MFYRCNDNWCLILTCRIMITCVHVVLVRLFVISAGHEWRVRHVSYSVSWRKILVLSTFCQSSLDDVEYISESVIELHVNFTMMNVRPWSVIWRSFHQNKWRIVWLVILPITVAFTQRFVKCWIDFSITRLPISFLTPHRKTQTTCCTIQSLRQSSTMPSCKFWNRAVDNS